MVIVSAGRFSFHESTHLVAFVLGVSCVIAPFAALSQSRQATTWKEFDLEVTELAENASFLAAEISNGTCEEVHGLSPELTLPIGSGFKLYILGELAQQIAQDAPLAPLYSFWSFPKLGWETSLDIQQRYKSIPQGPLRFVPNGSTFTLRYFAEQMIQRSDNTATDHLLFLLGRENVERRMAKMGHHDPAFNIPLVSTREFAIIKFLWTDEELATYLAASTAQRRVLLAREQRGYEELAAYFKEYGDQTLPTRIDRVEWFADRFDMCRALMSLHDMGQDPRLRPTLEALTLEDQIGVDREDWIYVGFKGGSELGVLAGNWLLQRHDGRLFAMVMALSDAAKALDIPRVIQALQKAVDILLQTP